MPGSRLLAALALVLALPSAAWAQSTITGVVRDTSGAVLPGVTVEVASDVLIEKTRSSVTDGAGQYRIAGLPPGTYLVTFTLAGFQTSKVDGINLPSEFVATVNGDMRVGALEESVTVTGQSSIVDVQSTTQSKVLNREVLDSLPMGKTLYAISQVIPGIQTSGPDVGGTRAMQQVTMSGKGMPASQTVVQLDGLGMNEIETDGGAQFYSNTGISEEMVYQTSGANTDVDGGGVRLNMIPKRGGNTLSGSFNANNVFHQSENLTADLVRRGLTVTDRIDSMFRIDAGVGGKIVKDKLWYYVTARHDVLDAPVADTFFRDGTQGIDDQLQTSGQARLTWQITPRNQITAYFDKLRKNRNHAMAAGDVPETASIVWRSPRYQVMQGKWTSTISTRTLLEVGYSQVDDRRSRSYQEGIRRERGTPEWYATASRVDTSKGTRTTAGTQEDRNWPGRYFVSSALSYVTGSHNIKVGFQHDSGYLADTTSLNADLQQNYQNGVPFQVVVYNTPVRTFAELNHNLGIYGQDAWTFKRLTLSYGVRWEYYATGLAEQADGVGQGRFVDARRFDAVKMPVWKTLSPRAGVAYDLFGNAKTALKFSAAQYRQMGTTGLVTNYNPIAVQTASLTWSDLNGNDIAEGERGCNYPSPGCEINLGQLPATFGQIRPGCSILATPGSIPCGSAQVDPGLDRTYSWNYSAGIQHEVLPGISVSATYFRTDYYNLRGRQNVLQTFDDYTPHQVVSPLDGSVITIYNVSAAKRNQVQNLDRTSPDRRQWYNGVDLTFNARLPRGGTLFGGTSTERQLTVQCDDRSNPNNLLYCDQRESGIPFQTTYKLAGSYTLPAGVVFSAVFQSVRGSLRGSAATPTAPAVAGSVWLITSATRYAPDCKGPCTPNGFVDPAMTVSSLSIPLVAPGTEFFDRINQLDLTFGRWFKVPGRNVRFQPEFSVFNTLNSSPILAQRSANFGTTSYQQPSSILQGRFFRLGMQVKW